MKKRYIIEGCNKIFYAINTSTMQVNRYKHKASRDLDVMLNPILEVISAKEANKMLNQGITK